MKLTEIDLRIDELLLDGVPVTDRTALANAVRYGLIQALRQSANQAGLHALRDRGRIDGGEIVLAHTDAATVGEMLAATIVSALRTSASRTSAPRPRVRPAP